MATPNYLGVVQPNASSGQGLLARIGSYFGNGGTPAYAGTGQPAPVAGGLLRPATPAYAAAPVKEQIDDGCTMAPAVAQSEATACPIDPGALASGHIAIVIPRERLGP
jgi:hypothetical protein